MARVTIHAYQRGVLFTDGRQATVLEPGRRRFRGRRSSLTVLDLRPADLRLPGQELLTQDAIAVKVGVVVRYTIADPVAFVLAAGTESVAAGRSWRAEATAREALRLDLQLALREVVAAHTVEGLLGDRQSASQAFAAGVAELIARYGVTVQLAQIRDIVLPADLRATFAAVLAARQEARAGLERARGEQATLRSLANSAKLVSSSPGLRDLRVLMAAERQGSKIVLDLSGEGSSQSGR